MAAQLRGNLTEKMEDGAGKVHFRRWKAMTIGARISLVVLVADRAHRVASRTSLRRMTRWRFTPPVRLPMAEFLFGTDDKGRDVLSRMMYGARYSLDHRSWCYRVCACVRLHHRLACRRFAQVGL